MNNSIQIIKENLPPGYEKTIAELVGCSIRTVNNILNGKHTKRSLYKIEIMKAASKLAKENLEPMQDLANTANAIESMTKDGSKKIKG